MNIDDALMKWKEELIRKMETSLLDLSFGATALRWDDLIRIVKDFPLPSMLETVEKATGK